MTPADDKALVEALRPACTCRPEQPTCAVCRAATRLLELSADHDRLCRLSLSYIRHSNLQAAYDIVEMTS